MGKFYALRSTCRSGRKDNRCRIRFRAGKHNVFHFSRIFGAVFLSADKNIGIGRYGNVFSGKQTFVNAVLVNQNNVLKKRKAVDAFYNFLVAVVAFKNGRLALGKAQDI